MAHAAPVVKLLNFILFQAVRDQASDIHLKPNLPPIFRIHGNLRQTDLPVCSPLATHEFALEILPPLQRQAFEGGDFEVDLAMTMAQMDMEMSMAGSMSGSLEMSGGVKKQ